MAERMIPDRFEPAVRAIRSLQHDPRYLGALIFGSVAEGRTNRHSDLDVVVQVGEDSPCPNVNHPGYWPHKVDITFRSLRQIADLAEPDPGNRTRAPILAHAVVLFDKTGELQALQDRMAAVRPTPPTRDDRQFIAFMAYHGDDKVRRNMGQDPDAALYSMHACIGDLLEMHFRLHERWWVSSKNVLRDLDAWDRPLAGLVRRFLATADVE
ncbi:MAG: nucleotidyltransferase domain-containing protein, partial [Nocardioides sp.]|nr:nucleotidyltransferase domain-containing protein [Nocardioides sp.]